MAAEEDVGERRAKTLRESSFRRQNGVENPGYETDVPYFVRLQSETGSTRDFEDRDRESQEWELPRDRDREWVPSKPQGRDYHQGNNLLKNLERGSDQWDLPKNQWDLPKSVDRPKREASEDFAYGQSRPKSYDPWREKPIPPPPATAYTEENGIPIPPVDYPLELLPDPQAASERPLSLQEAILDRTLRLKKVPEKLRKDLNK